MSEAVADITSASIHSLPYPKINAPYKRDDGGKFIPGVFATKEIEFLAPCQWLWTEKVDGTNIRVTFHGGDIHYGGRTDRAAIPGPLLRSLQQIFEPLRDSMRVGPITFYGEGYGPKIQNGGKYRDTPGFVLFDVYSGGEWYSRDAMEGFAGELGLDVVPLLYRGPLSAAEDACAEGFNSQWGDFEAEGMIGKPDCKLFDRTGKPVWTKVKCRDYRNWR